MKIKEYLINRVTLTIMSIIILTSVLMGVLWDSKTVSVVSDVFGIISFVCIVFVVGIILQYDPRDDRRNRLVRWKETLNSWVEPHKHLKWLQGDRAWEFLLLCMGGMLGLCGLGLRLWVDIIALSASVR